MALRLLPFAALIALAAFNNEKALWFTPLILVLEWQFKPLGWRRALAVAAVQVIVYGAIRLLVNAPPPEWTPDRVLARNGEVLLSAALLFMGGAAVWLVMLAQVWRRVHAWMRVVLLCTGFYIAPVLIFGIWDELPRLLLPVYLLAALAVLTEYAQRKGFK